MRLTTEQHASHPWQLPEIAPDFELLDAWALPVGGTKDEFEDLVGLWAKMDPTQGTSGPSRFLFLLRERLGRWFGWDDESNTLPIPGCMESSLRDRLPASISPLPVPKDSKDPFAPVFRTPTEWTAELSNSTVHAVLQLGWVPEPTGGFTGRMGVYVKTRGWLGPVYMAAIAPFRHWIVYPAMLRRIGRLWAERNPDRS
ncbi:MAG: DUF2867 domain-containing protein [Nannocystaceae bacterium]|nr:DUF2867 domain-containing protein [Nannocystaceae bacterium]